MRDNGILSIALNVSRTPVNQVFWIVISEEETGKRTGQTHCKGPRVRIEPRPRGVC